MASSSTDYSISWKYDVFLNFRGTDTRNNFTGHLRRALFNKGIHTFIDDQLAIGKVISPALLEAIESSRTSILVFSPDYASSTYCLDELVKILECHESIGQIVIPIFYKVSPEEVEKQTGRYGEAFTKHESMADLVKIKVWKDALSTATTFAGDHLNDRNEADFIQCIVERLCNTLNKKLLHVADYPVGLKSHMDVMNRMLSIGSQDVQVCMVGICGTGGLGKTTIAKATFNKFANQFEGSCFLANVRERSKQNSGIAQLQETLLFEILGDRIDLMGNLHLGINMLRDRLSSRSVFIVIDDVDNVDQLKKLAGELTWFGPRSRIIITTRDEHLLVSHGVRKVYKVKGLCDKDALKLFSWNAFKTSQPEQNYAALCQCVLEYVNGLPLALVVLGSHLYGRSVPQWKSHLANWKQNPNKEILDILKISFDALEDNEKAIFLHIACFFKSWDMDDVMQVLKACDFEPVSGIPILIERSLMSSQNGILEMHDLIQSMGWQIVHQESPNIPGERSRLWFHEDVVHVLTEDMGTHKIEAIMLDLPKGEEEVHLPAEAFTKMKRLRMLIIRNAQITGGPFTLPNELRWLHGPECPSESLSFMPGARKKLVVLKMSNSLIRQFGVGFKNFRNLKCMDLRYCEFLTEIPDLLTIPCLERLDFEGCTSLVMVHPSIGFLKKLVFLSFAECYNLQSLPSCFELGSLEHLLFRGCTKLEGLPNFKDIRNLKHMDCNYCICLTETPDFSTALSLESLTFNGCVSLVEIHPSIGFLKKLKILNLVLCSNLKSLPSCFKPKCLRELYLRGCTKLEVLPNTIGFLSQLQILCFKNCKTLTSVPVSIFKLPVLGYLSFDNCSELSISESTEQLMGSLMYLGLHFFFVLDLSGSDNIASIPPWISKFTNLTNLCLSKCPRLQEIPKLSRRIRVVEARDCKSLQWVFQLTQIFQLHDTEERSDEVTRLDFSNCHKLADNQWKTLENPPSSFDNRSSLKDYFSVVVPGSEILPWLDYKSEGRSLSFQLPSSPIYRKVEALLLCFVIASDVAVSEVSYNVFINGCHWTSSSGNFFELESNHIWFCYHPLHHFLRNAPWPVDYDSSFEVKCSSTNATVKRCGAHPVFRQRFLDCNPFVLFDVNFYDASESRGNQFGIPRPSSFSPSFRTSQDPPSIQELEDVHDEGWEPNGDPQRKRMRTTYKNESSTDENELLEWSVSLPLQPTVHMTQDPLDLDQLEDMCDDRFESNGYPQRRRVGRTDENMFEPSLALPLLEIAPMSDHDPLDNEELEEKHDEDSELHGQPQRKRMRMTGEHQPVDIGN